VRAGTTIENSKAKIETLASFKAQHDFCKSAGPLATKGMAVTYTIQPTPLGSRRP
jgi:hypothetical protein